MITCIKHNEAYINGICLKCENAKKGVHTKYSSMSPEHKSKYMLNSLQNLKIAQEKLFNINKALEKILKDFNDK